MKLFFNKFRTLGTIFFVDEETHSNKNSPENATKLLSSEKKVIEKQVDDFIDNKMLDLALIYADSGYVLTPTQEKSLNVNLASLPPHEIAHTFNKVLRKNAAISDEVLVNNFCALSSLIQEWIQKPKVHPFADLYRNKLEDEAFTKKMHEKWMSNIEKLSKKQFKRYESYEKNPLREFAMREVLEPFIELGAGFTHKRNLDELTDSIKLINIVIKKYTAIKGEYYTPDELAKFESLVKKLKDFADKNCGDEIKSNQKKISVLYDGNQLEKLIAEESMKWNDKNNVKTLPPKAKEIFECIKNDYLSLNKKLEDLTQEEKFNIENLWSQRIPEVLNKYLRVDPEFRTTMKNNQGQSIEDLLVDSMGNIHEILKKIQEGHSETVLHEMSAFNRYTKAIK